MVNLTLLKNKYNGLVSSDKDNFIKKANKIYETLKNLKVDPLKPLLINGNNNRDECMYAVGVDYSIKLGRVLNYNVITMIHFINQHFLEEEHRDMELYHSMYNTDILVITLNNYDSRGGAYSETTLIDLIETRSLAKKSTVIYAENIGNSMPVLSTYLNKYQVITAGNAGDTFSKASSTKNKDDRRFF